MNWKKVYRIAGATALATGLVGGIGSASATPVFGPGFNQIFFQNAENLYRPAVNCSALFPCIAFSPGNDPVGWQRVDNRVAGNIMMNDVFAGIINVQNIQSATTAWSQNLTPGSIDQLSGYFAQRVAQVVNPDTYLGGVLPPLAHLRLDAASTGVAGDPFSILGAGQQIALWVDSGLGVAGTAYTQAGLAPASIAAAINGAFFGSLGTGVAVAAPPPLTGRDADGYAYSHFDITRTLLNTTVEGFSAFNFVTTGSGYNLGPLSLINDNNEAEVGGLATNPTTGTCTALPGLAPVFGPPIACTQIMGTYEIDVNPLGLLANNYVSGQIWDFQSNDPFNLFVPEPGSLALLGLGLAALGWRRRRTSNVQ